MYVRKIKIGDTYYDVRDTYSHHIYNTLEDMLEDTQLIVGDYCEIKDFTDRKYIILESGTVDNVTQFQLDNNLYARLVPTSNLSAYGISADGETDDIDKINIALAYHDVIDFPIDGLIAVSNKIILNDGNIINGNNTTITPLNNNQFAVVEGQNVSNVSIKDLNVVNAYRGFFFLSSENITLNNLYVNVKNNWAYAFRLCKNVNAENLYEKADFPDNTVYNNTDCIHINGLIGGHFKNIYGVAYDDFIALNCDESTQDWGDITDVTFENVYTNINKPLIDVNVENECARCFRILCNTHKLNNVLIKNCVMKAKKLGIGKITLTENSTATEQLINNLYFENCKFSFDYDGYTYENPLPIDVKSGLIKFTNCSFDWNVDKDIIIPVRKEVNYLVFENCELNSTDNYDHNFIQVSENGKIGNLWISNSKCTLFNTKLVQNYGGNITDMFIVNNKIYGNTSNKKDVVRCSNSGQMRSIVIKGNITYFINKMLSVASSSQTDELIVAMSDNIYRSNYGRSDVEFDDMTNIRLQGDMLCDTDMTLLTHDGDHYTKVETNGILLKVVSNASLKVLDYAT